MEDFFGYCWDCRVESCNSCLRKVLCKLPYSSLVGIGGAVVGEMEAESSVYLELNESRRNYGVFEIDYNSVTMEEVSWVL